MLFAVLATAASAQPAAAPAPAAPVEPAAPDARPATAVPLPPPTLTMEQLDSSRSINVGDVLSFRVIEDRDPARNLTVTDAGDVEIPYIGRVQARGETCRSLALRIKALLEKDYYHRATVILAVDTYGQRSRGKIYVVGQVKEPGPQELPLGEKLTVSKAILNAGGMGDFAERRKVKLIRKKHANDRDPEPVLVDVKSILEEGKITSDPELQAEDLIIVPQRLINF